MTFVEPPDLLPGSPTVLGALAPALRRLAELQGSWPPRPPAQARAADPGQGRAQGAADPREQGRAVADAAADEGVDLLVLEGPDDPVPGLTALAALLELEPVAAVGTSGGPDWAPRLQGVRAGLPALRGRTAEAVVERLDPALAAATGLVEQAARRRTPVLLGSAPGAVAAVLLADRLSPGAASWVLAGCSSAFPGATRALEVLRLVPVVDLRLPGPGGALLADAVLATALELLGA